MRLRHFGYLVVLTVGFLPWAKGAIAQDKASFDAIGLDAALPLDKFAAQLATKQVVFVGEEHTRYDHHLNQLEIIKRLHELDPNVAIASADQSLRDSCAKLFDGLSEMLRDRAANAAGVSGFTPGPNREVAESKPTPRNEVI